MSNSSSDLPEAGEERRARPEIIAVALVAVVVGVVARFVTRSVLWLDEALSVDIARLPIGDIAAALKRDGHPPLYYVLLHGWIEVAGSGDVAVRALSGVIGVATMVLVWFLGRRRGGPTLAWILVGVVAVSPFAVRYSDEARMYALVMFLTVVGWFLLDDIIVRDRATTLRFVGLAVVGAALLYTHYWSLWLLAAVGLCALWGVWRRPEERKRWIGVVIALVAAGAMFLPWVPTMLYQAAHTGTPWAPPTRPTSAVSTTLADYAAGNFGEQALITVLLGIAIVLGLFGRGTSDRTIELDVRTRPQVRREAVVAALAFAIGVLVAFVSRSAYATRYSAVVFILVMLVIAAGITRFLGRWIRLGAFVVIVGTLSVGALWNITYERSQMKEIGRALTASLQPGDVVVTCPDQLGPSLRRRIPDDVIVTTFPDGGDGYFVDWVDYADRNAAADPVAFAARTVAQAGPAHTIWLVWSTSYKTLESKCSDLNAAFAAVRPTEMIVIEDGEGWYEHASLSRFAAQP